MNQSKIHICKEILDELESQPNAYIFQELVKKEGILYIQTTLIIMKLLKILSVSIVSDKNFLSSLLSKGSLMILSRSGRIVTSII